MIGWHHRLNGHGGGRLVAKSCPALATSISSHGSLTLPPSCKGDLQPARLLESMSLTNSERQRKAWTGKLGVLQSTGSRRVRHDLVTPQQQPCKVLVGL